MASGPLFTKPFSLDPAKVWWGTWSLSSALGSEGLGMGRQGEDVHTVLTTLAFPRQTCKIIQAIKSAQISFGDCHFPV